MEAQVESLASAEAGWAPPQPDLRAAIEACLQQLSPERRSAVALHLHGFPAAEAARALGWDVKRLQNLTYRGLDELRAGLAARGFEP